MPNNSLKKNAGTTNLDGCLNLIFKYGIKGMLFLVAGCSAVNFGVQKLTEKEHQCVEINEKYIKKTAGTKDNPGDDVFYIATDKGVFENKDALFYWKFNSADVQNSATAGSKYNIKTAGPRIPLLSAYPNVIEITPATCADVPGVK